MDSIDQYKQMVDFFVGENKKNYRLIFIYWQQRSPSPDNYRGTIAGRAPIEKILPHRTTYTTAAYHALILLHHTTYITAPYHLYNHTIPLILLHHTTYSTKYKEKHAEKNWIVARVNAPCPARCSRRAHAQLLLVLLARRARFRTQAGWRHPSLRVHCCQMTEITAVYL